MPHRADGLTIAALFAGIAGLERGLHKAGHRTAFFCENDPPAQRVLRAHYPDIPIEDDIRDLKSLPSVDVVAAGFPCQDLSQAGKTAGIKGRQSGLVREVFRLLEHADPTWVLLENVRFMLSLDRGRAMHFLVRNLERLGFRWAYRVLDTRAFGLPQRRQRVILLASRTEDPRDVLLTQDAGPAPDPDPEGLASGFYWTEGLRGLGWAVDAVPTLKSGSTVGIPSPPAIWMPDGRIVKPSLRDAERLQGFPSHWTAPAPERGPRLANGPRWRLIGNAVSVPVSRWVGQRLRRPETYGAVLDRPLPSGERWPVSAWSMGDGIFKSDVTPWPVRLKREHLHEFLLDEGTLLSARATAGFLERAGRSRLRFPDGFLAAMSAHLERQEYALAS